MDISSLTLGYLDQVKNSASVSKAESTVKSDYANASDEQLMNACKQFEAYFMEQMFKEMQNSIPKSEDTDGPTSNLVDYFKDSLTQQYAAEAAEQQNTGLASMLYEQMKRNYEL